MDLINQTYLYDFYGELLTEHQKRIYEVVVLDDYSISEVAKEEGISRQSVSELIKRCDRILQEYEKKLGLVSKFLKTKNLVEQIRSTGKELRTLSTDSSALDACINEKIAKIDTLCVDILREI